MKTCKLFFLLIKKLSVFTLAMMTIATTAQSQDTIVHKASQARMIRFVLGNKNVADTSVYELRLSAPLIDIPQNISPSFHYPSMKQSLEFSNDFYDAAFYGIDKLGDKLFEPRITKSNKHTFWNSAFKYGTGLGFARYGSELPIPLGVWAHEEFHRSVLGVNRIDSKNGNWILNRGDGTVYGVSDSALSHLKATNVNGLLYAYTAGVQSEILYNQKITLDEFYKQRSLNKTALLLYNAWYVFHYFEDANSSFTDSAKLNIPKFEDKNPLLRDFAGNDLTAWVYDMFTPDSAYTKRSSFPNGDGVNRHIGISDLSPEARSYLKKQKSLSLINVINPAIFFVDKIKIAPELSFNLFAQYAPTHFGHDIAEYLPVKYRNWNVLIGAHNYKGHNARGHGYDLGLMNYKVSEKTEADVILHYWQQPLSFFDYKLKTGFGVEVKADYKLSDKWSAFAAIQQKTKGWMLGNAYLQSNVSAQAGFSFNLKKQ